MRLTPEGLLLQDASPEIVTDVSGEFLWDYALRRRACAADIAGLLPYDAMDSWHEALKCYLLQKPSSGVQSSQLDPSALS